MSDYANLLPYLVAFVVLGGLAAAVALTVLVRVVAESRRTSTPGVLIRVPAARTEVAGTRAAASESQHARI
jgi:hypothetical protein